MEARIAKLEAHVEHMRSDIGEIKGDARETRNTLAGLKDGIHTAKIWALLLYIGLAGGLLFAMAKGFKWL